MFNISGLENERTHYTSACLPPPFPPPYTHLLPRCHVPPHPPPPSPLFPRLTPPLQRAEFDCRRPSLPQQTQDAASSQQPHSVVKPPRVPWRTLARALQDQHLGRHLQHQRRHPAEWPRVPRVKRHAEPAARSSVSMRVFCGAASGAWLCCGVVAPAGMLERPIISSFLSDFF